MKFALITEGVSEHRIIKFILEKYFKEQSPLVRQVQPQIVNEKQETIGGWNEVLKYCERTTDFEEIFNNNDFLIIQIDTDQSQQAPFCVSHTNKSEQELLEEVIKKISSLINPSIIEKYNDRIIFAVCIHTIECWMLPIFYSNNNAKKISGCLSALNSAFRKKDIHIITQQNKNNPQGIESYRTALRNWTKKQSIIDSSKHNYSFKHFINALKQVG